jgi:hypothetical protein
MNLFGIGLLKKRRGKKDRESARQLIGCDQMLSNKRVLQVDASRALQQDEGASTFRQ